ncbi:hypothetical protein CCR82_15200 [Halochromatium salexigens]|uniref:Uncharacterized protein n=1 Tax=Halochromatium salexigens TaxID=49447 RepID=A0AAJ0UIA8_HALSE|nr:hypothetical protein [Halochromatium salexigens]
MLVPSGNRGQFTWKRPSSHSIERSIMSHFAALEDPRSPTQRRHLLNEMRVMAIAATLLRLRDSPHATAPP